MMKINKRVVLNKCFPKKRNQVMFWEPWSIETNTVAMANYIAEHSSKKIYFAVPAHLQRHAKYLLNDKIKVINSNSKRSFAPVFFTSKYFFTAHWRYPRYYTSKQVIVNLWHGLPYKKICRLSGKNGVFAHLTVATSSLTQNILAEAFGVFQKSVIVSGYPRNDILFRSKAEKEVLKKRFEGNLEDFDKIILWVPTRRKDNLANHAIDGKPVDNPFQIEDFDQESFNEELNNRNILCIVKPHPMDCREGDKDLSNIRIIDDNWLWEQGLTLYHLAGISDILISDVSSIIIDYLLTDNPVVCFSTDWEVYKSTRGFVFEDIENWLPSKLIQDQDDFFNYIAELLTNDKDPYEVKRKELKDKFFQYQDADSAKRLTEYIFGHAGYNTD